MRLLNISVAACLSLIASTFAFAQGTIKVGQSAALNGPAAALGSGMREGAMAYFNQVNRAGGINGASIELVTLDDGYEPSRTVENTKKLISQDVVALFGYVGTPTSKDAIPLFTEAKVPFVGPFTGAELLRDPYNRYIFNVRASYWDETEKMVEQLTLQGVDRIAVFYQNDSFGQAGLTGVERAMKKRNLQIAAKGTVERNTVNVTQAVTDISKANPQAVIMVSAYSSCAAFIKAMKAAKANPAFINVSFVGSKALRDALGADAAGVQIAQVVPFPWNGGVKIVSDYQRHMAEMGKTQDQLDFVSLEGYIAARVLVEGMRKAGKTVTRESLIKGLESLNNTEIGGFAINFNPNNRRGSQFVELTIIGSEGKFMR